MDKLSQQYNNLKQAYRKYENLCNKEEIESEEEWQEFFNLSEEFINQMSKTSLFVNEEAEYSVENNNQLIERLLKSIDENKWEDVYLASNLINYQLIEEYSISLICKGVHKILAKNNLIEISEGVSIEWAKGVLLEYIVRLLDAHLKQEIVKQTLLKIISTVDADDSDNYHLIHASKSRAN
ncbi:MAG: hypothetical protein R3E32_02795 [Chitinophagales bacterium]